MFVLNLFDIYSNIYSEIDDNGNNVEMKFNTFKFRIIILKEHINKYVNI